MEILDAREAPETNLQYASFWIRVGAFLIDSIVILFASLIFWRIIVALIVEEGIQAWRVQVIAIIWQISIALYFALMDSSEKQATVGKLVLKIRVGDFNGERISFSRAIGRYFLKILSAAVLYIGFIIVAFDRRKQGLHDRIANTFVYHVKE